MSRNFIKYFIVTLSLVSLLIPLSAKSSTSDFITKNKNSKVRLIASYHEYEQQQKLIIGFNFKLKKNWKIYGKSNSSFVQPPTFDFSNSQNIDQENFKILWPQAKIIEEQILDSTISYPVYEDEITIPIQINVNDPLKPVQIQANISYGLCNKVCIPVDQSLKLTINPGNIDQQALDLIYKSLNHNSKPKKNITMTLISAIIISFIGGLILNIMPCVLPVLSIKLLSILKHSKSSIGKIRVAFASTIFGILFCFLIFASIVSILKMAGNYIGWGTQFQNPYFLIGLVVILTIFIANLLGLFEIHVGHALSNLIDKKIKKNNKKSDLLHVIFANFLSGILAVLLATPCSAPFLGTAISFAFLQDSVVIFTIFTFMALGLSFPYIILIIFPKSITLLPKPGNWMNKIKNLMAVFLAATIIWLIFILSGNIGFFSSILVAFFSTLILLCMKICAKTGISKTKEIIIISIISIFAIITPIKVSKYFEIKTKSYTGLWIKFDKNKINHYLDEGNVVIIDITADWCITCKVNKKLVLDSKEVVAKLKEANIIGMRGDLTKPNKEISDFLAYHNRYAIPFNIVYGPRVRDGVLLSEFLNKKELLHIIDSAQ